MPLKNFIKENFVLVTGLALPVLLVIAFFVASMLPQAMVEPPQYEVLYSETLYDNQGQPPYNVDFFVKDGALRARVWKLAGAASAPRKKLIAYDAKTQSVRELPYDLSKIGDVPNQAEMSLDEFKDMKVDGSNKAPDGYEFQNRGYGSGGLVTDIFGGGHRSGMPRIVKGAAVFKLPDNGNNYYGGNIQFVGWVIKK